MVVLLMRIKIYSYFSRWNKIRHFYGHQTWKTGDKKSGSYLKYQNMRCGMPGPFT